MANSKTINKIEIAKSINKIVHIVDLDRANLYGLLFRSISFLKGPITLIVIARVLTLTEQGFWYSFISLGALTIFAELGFTSIITQFVSHEFAHLKSIENDKIVGLDNHKDRFNSLIQFSFKLYFILILIALFFLSIFGCFYFQKTSGDLNTILAWFFYSFTGAGSLLVSLFGAIKMGCHKVAFVQKVSLISIIVSTLSLWLFLMVGFKIWALGLSNGINITVSVCMYYWKEKLFWTGVFNSKIINKVNWLKEMFSFQWRYTISAISGYFVYQSIIPLTVYYLGAEMGGKLGMTLAITTAVQGVALLWGNNKLPMMNALAAKKDLVQMDILIRKLHVQELSMSLFLIVVVVLTCHLVFPLIHLNNRILSIGEIFLLMMFIPPLVIISNWAMYLRSFKNEPFMFISLINAILIIGSVWLGVGYYKSMFITLISYVTITWISLFAYGFVYIKKRNFYLAQFKIVQL